MTHNQVQYLIGKREADAALKNAETNRLNYKLSYSDSQYNRETNRTSQAVSIVSTIAMIAVAVIMSL